MKQQPLLSAETCEKMNIIQLNETIHFVCKIQQKDLTKDYILAEQSEMEETCCGLMSHQGRRG